MIARTGRTYARIGLLATTLALAIALVVGALLNYAGARAAVSTLNRGQADLLESALRGMARPGQEDGQTQLGTLLEEFLSQNEESGVRYVAAMYNETVTASAGEPASFPAVPPRDTAGDRELVVVGDRLRAYFARPPLRNEIERVRDGSASGDGGRRGRGRSPLAARWPAFYVVEFEPVVATGLVSRAARSAALAALGATILSVAAILFWRTTGRYEETRLRLEEQRRLTVLGEMSAVLAHEIRNPLASLKGNAQLLAERLDDRSREKARAERVVTEATRLEALTSDLLDFARSGPLETTAVDPVALVRTAAADVAPDGFDIVPDGAPQRWAVDPRRIRQALVNILQNARQAAPHGRPPRVTVGQSRDGLEIAVRDFGPGLPAGSEERIFDPFYTTRTSGTGLGLAVARRVTELHGGRIEAGNHPEGGAVFRIVLPREA